MTSTPNGDMDIFSQIWRGAQVSANGFHYLFVPWDAPPGRDEQFKEHEIGRIGERRWKQEYECQFLSSDALLIESIVLHNITKIVKQKPIIKEVKEVSFWKEVKEEGTYLVGVDPATGSGNDYSVITVFEFPSLEQVAQYRSNTMSTNDLYAILKNILSYLESKRTLTYFSIENNGVGEGIIALYESDEEIPENAEFISEQGSNRRGMTTTAKTKMKACINLKELIEKDNMKISSDVLLAELKSFTRQRGSYAAARGSTDDCISAVLIVVRLLEEIASYEQEAFDKLYSQLGNDEYDPSEWDGYDGGYDENDGALPVVL